MSRSNSTLFALIVTALVAAWTMWPSPVPPEVRARLPIPKGAAVHDEECGGTVGRPGYLCVLTLTSAMTVPEAEAWVRDHLSGWREVAWDDVPGRVQLSMEDDAGWFVAVALFPHEVVGRPGSTWSLHAGLHPPGQPPAPVVASLRPTPDPAMPDRLAPIPLPPGAVLVAVDTADPLRPIAELRVADTTLAVAAFYDEALPELTRTMRTRNPMVRSWQWTRPGEVLAVHAIDEGGVRLRLSSWPAPP